VRLAFVEAGFEDVEDAQSGAGFLQCAGDLQAQLFVFNHARPGDQKQPARRVEIFPDGGVVEHTGVFSSPAAECKWRRATDARWENHRLHPILLLGHDIVISNKQPQHTACARRFFEI